jgi:hypothetical protein|tara:strand:- start:412 stop:825 length:414 start_codon:yes stop_codon:yes gene_type:complete
MSFHVDTRRIVGIYALGQWFKVKPFSVVIDSWTLCSVPFLPFSETEFGTPGNENRTYIDLCHLYPDFKSPQASNEHRRHGDEAWFENPSSSHGLSAVLDNDDDTKEEIAFSLLEVRAFKYISEGSAESFIPLKQPHD